MHKFTYSEALEFARAMGACDDALAALRKHASWEACEAAYDVYTLGIYAEWFIQRANKALLDAAATQVQQAYERAFDLEVRGVRRMRPRNFGYEETAEDSAVMYAEEDVIRVRACNIRAMAMDSYTRACIDAMRQFIA